MLQAVKKNPGLLWGLAVRAGRTARMGADNAADVLAMRHDWCWMHFALSDHRARRFLEGFEQAPKPAREMLLEGETRPQLHLGPGCAWGVIPDFEKDFEGQSFGEGSVAFYLDADYLFTTRHHPMRVVDEVRERIQSDTETPLPAAPVDVFVMLNERFVEIAEKRFAVFARWLDRLEDRVLGEQGELDRTGLGSVRREVARFHREFAGLRAAYHRAMSSRVPIPDNPVTPPARTAAGGGGFRPRRRRPRRARAPALRRDRHPHRRAHQPRAADADDHLDPLAAADLRGGRVRHEPAGHSLGRRP
jgi:Mg2+ and Co2+ transporter CorA